MKLNHRKSWCFCSKKKAGSFCRDPCVQVPWVERVNKYQLFISLSSTQCSYPSPNEKIYRRLIDRNMIVLQGLNRLKNISAAVYSSQPNYLVQTRIKPITTPNRFRQPKPAEILHQFTASPLAMASLQWYRCTHFGHSSKCNSTS